MSVTPYRKLEVILKLKIEEELSVIDSVIDSDENVCGSEAPYFSSLFDGPNIYIYMVIHNCIVRFNYY